MKTISAFNRSHTRQGNAWERSTCSPLKKGCSEKESDGAFGSGQCRVSLGFEPLPTREPMLSPFHAYSIAHKMRFVKGFWEKSLRFFEKIFGERERRNFVRTKADGERLAVRRL